MRGGRRSSGEFVGLGARGGGADGSRYSAPFDRHDWTVDRPVLLPDGTLSSVRIRYVIDFYTGRLPAMLSPDCLAVAGVEVGAEDNFRPNLAFFLDVRPAVDGWEGVRMRSGRVWRNWFGGQEERK